MTFIRYHIKQLLSGGMPVLWRKLCAFPGWFATSKYGNRVAYYSVRMAVYLRPDWATGHVMLAESLISLGRFAEGIVHLRKAISLRKEDMYPELYRIAVVLFTQGQMDVVVRVLRMGMEAQEEFARVHQLDRLGINFLRDWTYSIGGIAHLDFYVKMGILGLRGNYHPIVLDAKPANRCYLDYWRRYLPDMITDPIGVKLLTPLAARLEAPLLVVTFGDGRKMDYFTAATTVQELWQADGRGPLLTLSNSDYKRGWQCLNNLGVPTGAWFVALHVRYASFTNARNADINTYLTAIDSIVSRGGWVIRIGDTSMPPLPPMPNVIDYAQSKVRSDWMDVFVLAGCRFFVGTNSGPFGVPPTFGVPCVETNWAPMGLRPWFSQDIQICKLHWSKKMARYLNFAEVINSASGWAESTEYITSHGIKLVDNTPEEINDVVTEMIDRLDGKLQYSKEDEEMQERFDRIYIKNACKTYARTGRDFLRKWAHLL